MNNPFKLWGSYMGLVFGLIGAYFSFTAVFTLCEFGPCRPTVLLIPVIVAVFGFVLGYLIHSLVLNLKK